jgi:hypothetical protein
MAMAQEFHGVTVSGTGKGYAITNHSTKPVMGWAIQSRTANGGLRPISGRVDFGSWAAGKPMQPGEERHAAMLRGFSSSRLVRVGTTTAWEEVTTNKEEILSYELTAVLFADGTFYGPDDVFQDFSGQVDTVRSQARDALYAQDKYDILSQQRMSPRDMVNAMRNPNTDIQALVQRSGVAQIILSIRDAKGESEAAAAIGRLAALPDVQRGEGQ